MGSNAASDIEKARFCKKKIVVGKYCLDPEPVPEVEPLTVGRTLPGQNMLNMPRGQIFH
jgi:hypothetical protein